jgi:hypothetical protein
MGQKVKPIANYQLLIPFIKKALGISLGALCFGVRSGKPKKPQLIPGCRFLMSVGCVVSGLFHFPAFPRNTNFAGASHFCSQAINWSWEPGGKRKKEGTRRSVFRNMRCSQLRHSLLIHLPPIRKTNNATTAYLAISHHKDREVCNSPILRKHPSSVIPHAVERQR